MSAIDVFNNETMADAPQEAADARAKTSYKSYKKKYNKLRHVFKDKMKASNMLFEDEQRMLKIARRLQEQNDQLLDLLLEVNESSRIPIHLRYDLRSPTPSESALPGLEPDLPVRKTYDTSSARAALEEAKTELETGQISPRSYNKLEVAINETLQNPVSLSDLRRTTHTQLGSVKALPHDIGDALPAGYLTFEHEEEYLSVLDAAAGVPPSSSQTQLDSHPIRSNEKEKELALRNPVSVYNWLRKNHPSIFLQDSDSSPDKPITKSSGTSRSAKKTASAVKTEEEVLDEAGNIIGGVLVEAPARSKRKREDEPYRPKGGSSRPSKRKKTSVGQSEKPHVGEDEVL